MTSFQSWPLGVYVNWCLRIANLYVLEGMSLEEFDNKYQFRSLEEVNGLKLKFEILSYLKKGLIS